jgi:hypothetical protein
LANYFLDRRARLGFCFPILVDSASIEAEVARSMIIKWNARKPPIPAYRYALSGSSTSGTIARIDPAKDLPPAERSVQAPDQATQTQFGAAGFLG